MNFKPLYTIIAIAGICFCCNTQSIAQSDISISGQRLAAIEQEMFADSNQDFIIIDLVMDGVMKPGDECHFSYTKGVSYFAGKKLDQKLQEKYKARLDEFCKYTGSSTKIDFGITSDPISANKILDPNSSLRKPIYNYIKKRDKLKKLHDQGQTEQQ